MPGFETIVRPMVFPNIRPIPTRSLPPEDDPEQGKCEIGGGGGGIVAVTENISVSGSTHNPKEVERRVDTARVYQENDDGTVNRDNFVDLEVANRIKMKVGAHPGTPGDLPPGAGFNGDDVVKTTAEKGYTGDDLIETYKYDPVKEKKNIEIKKKNVIKKAKES